jgi:hypothetical protein
MGSLRWRRQWPQPAWLPRSSSPGGVKPRGRPSRVSRHRAHRRRVGKTATAATRPVQGEGWSGGPRYHSGDRTRRYRSERQQDPPAKSATTEFTKPYGIVGRMGARFPEAEPLRPRSVRQKLKLPRVLASATHVKVGRSSVAEPTASGARVRETPCLEPRRLPGERVRLLTHAMPCQEALGWRLGLAGRQRRQSPQASRLTGCQPRHLGTRLTAPAGRG